MAIFITKCPHCNAELQAQDEWVGMAVECPACHNTFIIGNSNSSTETPRNQAFGANEKTCPFCGNSINIKAVRCKFCKQDLIKNQGVYNEASNKNRFVKRFKWNQLNPLLRTVIMTVIVVHICSGLFCVWYANDCIKRYNIDKRLQAYDDAMGHSRSLSPINYLLDTADSFFTGFFFCYGGNFSCDENLLDKQLYRYGVSGKNEREAELKTIEIWYNAKKVQASNEGRYLDY